MYNSRMPGPLLLSLTISSYLKLTSGICDKSPKVQRAQLGWSQHRQDCFHAKKTCCLVWEDVHAEAANQSMGFLLFRRDIKLSLSVHTLLTFIGPMKKANATKPSGKWSICFALNTLLTDCRAGMVWRTQTVCRPVRAPPYATLVHMTMPTCQWALPHCPHL